MLSISNIKKYLEEVVWQYENWHQIRDSFLINLIQRENLYQCYQPTFGSDINTHERRLLDELLDELIVNKYKNTIVLLGEEGAGKSVFALHYYIYLAEKYLNDDISRIPIFISLKDYIGGEFNIEDIVRNEFEKFNIKLNLFFRVFEHLALLGKLVFIIDGFNEITTDQEKSKIKKLKELAKLSYEHRQFLISKLTESNKVICTCRTDEYLTSEQEQKILKEDFVIRYRNYVTKHNYDITKVKLVV